MNELLALLAEDKTTKLYSDDVFSIDTYQGTGAPQVINNGINLASLGGMVWTKMRSGGTDETNFWSSTAVSTVSNYFTDSERGNNLLSPASTTGEIPGFSNDVTFRNDGFEVGTSHRMNKSGCFFSSWTFRRAPKFFDVVKWTGNGISGRQIPHILGTAPGMIVVKRLDASVSRFIVYHRELPNNTFGLDTLPLSTIAPYFGANDSQYFSVTNHTEVNENGVEYVAYLFAHDTSEDGIIQCGSYTTDSFGRFTVNLGWEPDYLLIKQTNSVYGWMVLDSVRDFFENYLYPHLNGRESKTNTTHDTQGNGFSSNARSYTSPHHLRDNSTYIYVAIRRKRREPVAPDSVMDVQVASSPSSATTVKYSDFILCKGGGFGVASVRQFRSSIFRLGYSYPLVNGYTLVWDRKYLSSVVNSGVNISFARSPGVFDCQRYTGNRSAPTRQLFHQLGVAPELWMIKQAVGDGQNDQQWVIGSSLFPEADDSLFMSSTSQLKTSGKPDMFSYSPPTDKYITLGQDAAVNFGGWLYLAIAFASKPGISKVLTYDGNGSQQTIDCGFTNGARFILIKRYNGPGNWAVFNSASGIVTGVEPRFYLDDFSAQSNLDCVDPSAVGFIVKENSVGLNTVGGKYICLALA